MKKLPVRGFIKNNVTYITTFRNLLHALEIDDDTFTKNISQELCTYARVHGTMLALHGKFTVAEIRNAILYKFGV